MGWVINAKIFECVSATAQSWIVGFPGRPGSKASRIKVSGAPKHIRSGKTIDKAMCPSMCME